MENNNIVCRFCGEEINNNSTFCSECNNSINELESEKICKRLSKISIFNIILIILTIIFEFMLVITNNLNDVNPIFIIILGTFIVLCLTIVLNLNLNYIKNNSYHNTKLIIATEFITILYIINLHLISAIIKNPFIILLTLLEIVLLSAIIYIKNSVLNKMSDYYISDKIKYRNKKFARFYAFLYLLSYTCFYKTLIFASSYVIYVYMPLYILILFLLMIILKVTKYKILKRI